MKVLVILGTARDESNTLTAVTELCPFEAYELIDLGKLAIDPYSYEGPTEQDDFLLVVQKMERRSNCVCNSGVLVLHEFSTKKFL